MHPLHYAAEHCAFMRDYLQRLLATADGHMGVAAEISGVNRSHLYRMCRQYSVDPDSFRSGHFPRHPGARKRA